MQYATRSQLIETVWYHLCGRCLAIRVGYDTDDDAGRLQAKVCDSVTAAIGLNTYNYMLICVVLHAEAGLGWSWVRDCGIQCGTRRPMVILHLSRA